MHNKFPIITSPTLKRNDFQAEFERILATDFKELIIISPFVDGEVITNVLRHFRYNDKNLTIASRYGDLYKDQKQRVTEAAEKIVKFAEKDPTITTRIRWLVVKTLHAKLVIRDWMEVLFGSQNFTYSAWRNNYELGALIDDPAEVAKVRPFVEDLLKNHNGNTLFPRKVRK